MVMCVECGYLAVRNRNTYDLDEAGKDFRETGRIAVVYDSTGHNQHALHELIPLCFVGCQYINEEINKIGKGGNYFTGIQRIIKTEIECNEFIKWKRGYTPKEHREMMDRQEWRNWQAQQRREDKRWRIIELVIFGVIAVLIAGGFSVLGAFIERGTIP